MLWFRIHAIQTFKKERRLVMGLIYFLSAFCACVLILWIYNLIKYRDILFKKKD